MVKPYLTSSASSQVKSLHSFFSIFQFLVFNIPTPTKVTLHLLPPPGILYLSAIVLSSITPYSGKPSQTSVTTSALSNVHLHNAAHFSFIVLTPDAILVISVMT